VVDEADRSNCIIERALEVWGELAAVQRVTFMHDLVLLEKSPLADCGERH
jgi:hypothetical protein